MINVAISGKMFAGKTTSASILMGMYPFTKMAFGDGMKDIVSRIFNVPTDGPNKDRETLQWFATVCREKDPDCWVRMLIENWERMGNPPTVVDDVRLLNEAETLKINGFYLIRLEVSPSIQRQRAEVMGSIWDEDKTKHISETALDDYQGWDLKLNGNLPMDVFEDYLKWIWEQFIHEHDQDEWEKYITRRLI